MSKELLGVFWPSVALIRA